MGQLKRTDEVEHGGQCVYGKKQNIVSTAFCFVCLGKKKKKQPCQMSQTNEKQTLPKTGWTVAILFLARKKNRQCFHFIIISVSHIHYSNSNSNVVQLNQLPFC